MPDVNDLLARIREAQSLLTSAGYRVQADALHRVTAAVQTYVPDEPRPTYRAILLNDGPMQVRAENAEEARSILTDSYGVDPKEIVTITRL